MKTRVDTYRGFEISFDTDSGTFTAWSDHRDAQFSKKSYSGIKLGVDEHIKDNSSFRPFRVQEAISSYGEQEVKTLMPPILITGIRKDGKPTYEEDGKKKTIGKHDLSGYIIYLPENEPIGKTLSEMDAEIKEKNKQHRVQRLKVASRVTIHKLTDRLQELKEQD